MIGYGGDIEGRGARGEGGQGVVPVDAMGQVYPAGQDVHE